MPVYQPGDQTGHQPRRGAGHRGVRCCLLSLALLTSACALLPQPSIQEPAVSASPEWTAPAVDAQIFRIDHARLELHTYRAGWLSGLAHNHVMETEAVHGEIHLTDPIAESSARLYFRPWDLTLDDPETREAAGAGFESARTAEDIAATRTRMLGPRGFDNNQHPYVTTIIHWLDESRVELEISFRGEVYLLEAPLNWSRTRDAIMANADFEISHRALDLKPYSAFAGAIAVAEPIRIQLELSASRM